MEDDYKKCDKKVYDLYLLELLWASIRVLTEMKISNVKYLDVIEKCKHVINKNKKEFFSSKNISLKKKIKIHMYIYFYIIIAQLKKIKRKI